MVEITRPAGSKAGVCRRVTPAIRVVVDIRAAIAGVGPDARRVLATLPQAKFGALVQ